MNKLSKTKCDVCLRKCIKTKVRTICNECREFLCKECSDTHLLHRSSMNHSLIDMDPPGEEDLSANENELASHFKDMLTISETTVLYRAQVALEGGERSNGGKIFLEKQKTKVKQGNLDIKKIDMKFFHEFNVSSSEDKADPWVTALVTLNDKTVITDRNNHKLKLFDLSGNFISSTDIKDFPLGVTLINKDQFATCGYGNKVFLWAIRGQTIVSEDESYEVDHSADCIHFNGTYYCVLHRWDNGITILDIQGKRVRKIVMNEAFGQEIGFGWDIHMDRDKHDIYVPCMLPNSGVLCMSVEGEALWFTPLSNATLYGMTRIQEALCITDFHNNCLHMLSKTGQYMKKLPEIGKMDGQPMFIYYNERNQQLYISHNPSFHKGVIISVYKLQ